MPDIASLNELYKDIFFFQVRKIEKAELN